MLVGTLIGTVSTLFIYPLDEGLYGTLQFLIAAAALLAPVAGIGVQALTVRFFPEFTTEDGRHHGFLGLIYLLIAVGILVFSVVAFFLKEEFFDLLRLLEMDVAIFKSNLPEIFALLCVTLFVTRTHQYLTNYQRIVVPYVLLDFWLKLAIPAFVLLAHYQILEVYAIKWLFIALKVFSLLGFLYYTYQLGALQLRIDWSFLTRARVKSMANYALFGIFGSLSTVIAFQIDKVMVTGYEGVVSNGIYSIALFISNIMIIPSKSVIPLVSAQISQLSVKGDQKTIEGLYHKSSITLLIAGLGFFLLIWWNIEDVFSLTTNKEALMLGKYVVLYLGIAKLIDMVTGVNSQIIAFSRYFRWNLLFIVIMGILTVSANMYFIPRLGITGAAVATLISLTTFNLLKFAFIWYVFGMQPFNLNTVYILLLGILASLGCWWMPETTWPLLNIALRSLLVFLLFAVPIYVLRLSEDISALVEKYLRMLFKALGR